MTAFEPTSVANRHRELTIQSPQKNIYIIYAGICEKALLRMTSVPERHSCVFSLLAVDVAFASRWQLEEHLSARPAGADAHATTTSSALQQATSIATLCRVLFCVKLNTTSRRTHAEGLVTLQYYLHIVEVIKVHNYGTCYHVTRSKRGVDKTVNTCNPDKSLPNEGS